MDDATKAYLEAMEARLMLRMNDQFERVINDLGVIKDDLQQTKSFLLDDAVTLGRRMRIVEDRVDRLERK